MNNRYDLIVIGSGSGASGAARRCLKAGWKVAMIDERPFGGTCALRGCDMKKILMASAEVVGFANRMQGYGVDAAVKVVWPQLMEYKRSFINGYSERMEKGLADAGMEIIHGTARFVSPDEIEVGGQVLKAKHILIASGAHPAPLQIPGKELITISDEFLEMDQLPHSIVFLGGGMISMEFAHIAARAGAKVTVMEAGGRPLQNFDEDLSELMVKKSQEIGIEFLYGARVSSVAQNGSVLAVECNQNGKQLLLEAEMVVHGAGRIPNIQSLNLEAGNVAFGKNGVSVNEFMQSVSNGTVYSAGDAADTSGPKLTPVAGMESYAAGENLIFGNKIKPDYRAVPSVLFTVPRIASVGLSSRQARDAGFETEEKKTDMSSWYTYKRTHEKYAFAKIILEKGTQKILGAHLAGGEADELINLFAAAIARGETAQEMKELSFAYPTAASDIEYMV